MSPEYNPVRDPNEFVQRVLDRSGIRLRGRLDLDASIRAIDRQLGYKEDPVDRILTKVAQERGYHYPQRRGIDLEASREEAFKSLGYTPNEDTVDRILREFRHAFRYDTSGHSYTPAPETLIQQAIAEARRVGFSGQIREMLIYIRTDDQRSGWQFVAERPYEQSPVKRLSGHVKSVEDSVSLGASITKTLAKLLPFLA